MGSIISCFNKDAQKEAEDYPISQDLSKPKPKATPQDLTIMKLKTAQDRLLAQKGILQKNADSCADEAKQYIAEKKRDQAVFALKRQKLYEQYLQDSEDKYHQIQKSIQDLESAIITSNYTVLLQEINELIKQIESANALEQQQENAIEGKMKGFDTLFNQNEIMEEELAQLYNKFEGQVITEKIHLVSKRKENEANNVKINKKAAESSPKMNEKKENDEVEKRIEAN